MKKIEFICVGKIKERFFNEAANEYVKRLSRFCSLSIIEIKDEGDEPTRAKQLESEAIINKLGGFSILLDVGGDLVSSEKFSTTIDNAYNSGNTKVQIIIGGSHGISDALKSKVSSRVSFGRVTYPHKLMRVIALEQVYRAFGIIYGTPYHK